MKTSEASLRPRSAVWGLLFILPALLLMCIVASPHAHAEDKDEAKSEAPSLKEQLDALKEKFKEAKKKKDVNAMSDVIDASGDLYEDCCDDIDLQLEVIKFTGTAAKGTKGHEVKVLVLRKLADMGDLRAAKYIKPYLRQANPKKASETLKAAVQTASEVPDPSLVPALLKIVTRSKTTYIMGEAVYALGKFKGAKKYRAKILTTLVDEARKVKPGNRPRMRGTQEQLNGGTHYGRESGPGARWAALSAAVPVALRELTGQDIRSLGEWMTVVKNHKGKVGSLFQSDE